MDGGVIEVDQPEEGFPTQPIAQSHSWSDLPRIRSVDAKVLVFLIIASHRAIPEIGDITHHEVRQSQASRLSIKSEAGELGRIRIRVCPPHGHLSAQSHLVVAVQDTDVFIHTEDRYFIGT